MAIRLATLGSGSGGNATLVEGGGVRVLVDAGFSCRRLVQRLRFVGVDPASVDAILLTHEHGDHLAGAAAFAASFGAPIYCTRGTAAAAGFAADGVTPVLVRDGEAFAIGTMQVRPFAVPHDAAETVGFVLEAGGVRAGYVTDLGHDPESVRSPLRGADLLVVESNHDVDLLRAGPYPEHVKARVLGRYGHLDNEASAAILADVAGRATRAIVLAHLSATNNQPALALAAARRRLGRGAHPVPTLHPAAQEQPSPWFEA
ncbi:MAG TPA: MBL fold metallo-hydrolase [Dongiaceae bacterium]|nr:MBL fold metallo-hydrolase [Dongiaceae bacterium]